MAPLSRPRREGLVVGLIAYAAVAAFYAVVAQAGRRPARAHLVVANALAVLLAGSYVVHRHPGLWRRLIPFSESSR